jgi:hypothetical protein
VWSGIVSIGAVVATALAAPWLIARLPEDYFTREQRASWVRQEGVPVVTRVADLVKNAVGLVLVVLGLIMLLTPGQGILTILAGLLLMNFPGKYKLERRLVSQPGVMRAMNWLRARRAKPPFEPPSD